MKRKIFFASCESCEFIVNFEHNNETLFFCKEHEFGVNVSNDQLNIKHICKLCQKEMERYDLEPEDSVCPICERWPLELCYTYKDLGQNNPSGDRD